MMAEGWARIDYLKHPGPATQLKMRLAISAREGVVKDGIVMKLTEGVAVEEKAGQTVYTFGALPPKQERTLVIRARTLE